MSKIGQMKLNKNGSYSGKLSTLGLDFELDLIPNEQKEEGDTKPDFKAISQYYEAGAGWKKTSDNDNPYLSITLDDPSFITPINTNLVLVEGEYILLWQRKK